MRWTCPIRVSVYAPAVDRATHRRYLAYRETFPYFHPSREVMLTRDEYAQLDAAYVELEALPAEARSEDDQALLGRLKKLLLRD